VGDSLLEGLHLEPLDDSFFFCFFFVFFKFCFISNFLFDFSFQTSSLSMEKQFKVVLLGEGLFLFFCLFFFF